jgi:hypothetical protein
VRITDPGFPALLAETVTRKLAPGAAHRPSGLCWKRVGSFD